MTNDDVVPLERIRRYRTEVNRREIASHLYNVSKFLIEVSTIAAVLGRGLKYISRELGYDEPRRIRFPID